MAFRGKDMDWQLWIEADSTPLPRRVVIVDRGAPGWPRYTATLSDWNTSPTLSQDTFTFSPPAAAQKIPFVPAGSIFKRPVRCNGESDIHGNSMAKASLTATLVAVLVTSLAAVFVLPVAALARGGGGRGGGGLGVEAAEGCLAHLVVAEDSLAHLGGGGGFSRRSGGSGRPSGGYGMPGGSGRPSSGYQKPASGYTRPGGAGPGQNPNRPGQYPNNPGQNRPGQYPNHPNYPNGYTPRNNINTGNINTGSINVNGSDWGWGDGGAWAPRRWARQPAP